MAAMVVPHKKKGAIKKAVDSSWSSCPGGAAGAAAGAAASGSGCCFTPGSSGSIMHMTSMPVETHSRCVPRVAVLMPLLLPLPLPLLLTPLLLPLTTTLPLINALSIDVSRSNMGTAVMDVGLSESGGAACGGLRALCGRQGLIGAKCLGPGSCAAIAPF